MRQTNKSVKETNICFKLKLIAQFIFQLQIKRNSTILPSSEAHNLMEVQKVRKDLREIFDAAVRSVYPPQMVRNSVTVSNDGNYRLTMVLIDKLL